MTTPLRRRIRHTRRWLGYGLMVLLILVATVVGIANQLLPLVEQHPQQIAAWLSERVGEPVSFSHAKAEWTRRGPRFTLDDLRVGRGDRVLDIGRAQLQIAMYSGLLPNHPLTEFKVRELALTLVQEADGRWHAVGLPGQGQGGDPLGRLEGLGELQIEKAKLRISAPRLRMDLALPRVDVRLRVYGNRLLAGASVWAKPGGAAMSAVLDMQRDSRDGTVWLGGDRLVLADWAPALASLGLVPKTGTAELGAWLRLRDQRVDRVTVEADIADLHMASADEVALADGSRQALEARFDRLRMTARWQGSGKQWYLTVPRFQVDRDKRTARLDGLEAWGGERFALRAAELDLQPLASLLALGRDLPPSLRAFLSKSQPYAVLRQLDVRSTGRGRVRGSVQVAQLGLDPFGSHPGVAGLAGDIVFDQDGGVMSLLAAPVRVDWPAGLRQPVQARVDGSLSLYRDGPGWTLGGHGLSIRGEDFGARARFELGFQGDGSKPTLDLAADLDPATVATAKKFWILHKMPPATVQWLDEALVEGDVLDGRIAIGGDLDDWPFRNHGGSFDARATIRGGVLHFSPDWPEARDFNADVAFDGPGFSVAGEAMLLGNRVDRVRGGIADFHQPVLDLDIAASSVAEKLRALMIASPLNKDYGEHLKAVTMSGRADVALKLRLPLGHAAGEKTIDGSLDLARAKLADSRWDIAFSDVSGRTRFDQHGFATEDLHVRLDDQPGVFNLRVGPQAGEPGLAALATLRGRFTPPTLLRRYEGLAWLKPFMSGSSDWDIGVRIPSTGKDKKTPPSRLSVSSDLVGTALSLPAPLAKGESASLPLELQLALPVEQGQINLRLGELMRLRGVLRGEAPLNGSVQFGPGALVPAPPQGMSIRGTVPLLDSTGWIGFSSDAEAGGAGIVHDVDIQARQLNLVDRAFADTRLQLQRDDGNIGIRLDGAGVEGSIEVPDDLARGVQAKFARLYLAAESATAAPVAPATTAPVTPVTPAAASAAASPAKTGAGPAAKPGPGKAPAAAAATTPAPDAPAMAGSLELDDPSALPSLHFSIADLRLGQAQLGQAELQTTQTASGMRVDKFQSRSKSLSIDAGGEWIREGSGSRSNFHMDFAAGNLGKMLDSLGYVGMVQGGKTKARLSGSWPGSPGAFSLATLRGQMKADIGEGRLIEVEPGGSGRILGLISLAEIPRRLTLDFSDFFAKGFSFNYARGDFEFDNGMARTENLRIDGPAAEIRVSGSTGLRDQTYDQRVEVLPKAGGVLPALGMLAGGPAGAAVGAVAQAVLQRPLKQTTRTVYHVSGPWADPKVEVIEKGPAKNVPAPAAEGEAKRP